MNRITDKIIGTAFALMFIAIFCIAGCTQQVVQPQTPGVVSVVALGQINSNNLNNSELHEFITASGIHCIQSHVSGALALACEFPKTEQAK